MSRRDSMKGVLVEHKRPRKKPAILDIDPEEIRRQVSPFATQLPSHRTEPDVQPENLRTRAEFANEIKRLWLHAEQQFISIGRRLNEAKEHLNHGQFMDMVAADLPFSHSVANRLMRVAAGIDAGAVSLDRLPPSYATIYEVLTLTSEEREKAEAEGVIRPDMRRQDLADFKRRLRQAMLQASTPQAKPQTPEPIVVDRQAELEARRAVLLAELEQIDAELATFAS
jgi:hypothetical protein